MNLDLLFAIIFYGIIFLLFLKYRHKFDIQNKIFVLYRTKIGLRFMDSFARKFPGTLKVLAFFSAILGFIGSISIFYVLFKGSLALILEPSAEPVLAPVFPGIEIPGAPALSFWHWIIAIFIVAIVHEFSHGIFARLSDVKIKSSGFAFLGPILAAFVEPDEKQLQKKSLMKQLEVFSSGAFANFITGLFFLLILIYVMTPIQFMILEPEGIEVNNILEDTPAARSELEAPFLIKEINGEDTKTINEFVMAIKEIKPKEEILLKTDKGNFKIITTETPDDKERGFIGISDFNQRFETKPAVLERFGSFLPKLFSWFRILFLWVFLINIGVGLFNLLPLGPLDGGRMYFVTALALFKDQKKAIKVFSIISFICLFLIIINLLPWFNRLFIFIFSSFP